MNIFRVHSEILENYSSYINSFIDIKDERINQAVDEQLGSQKLWPEPLIQFNPSFEVQGSIDDLCNTEKFSPELANVFSGFNLFKHQIDALKLGIQSKSFIVTSGTGSGKSLTFLGAIFNHLFSSPKQQGIKALIVYPMNALINSQTLEIQKFADRYEAKTGRKFPFTFRQYTGQEDQQKREEIRDNPPDILLTNYMMLELITTRLGESTIKQSIANNLKFLVFDELHIYRGRQGADVSMLIRRIKALRGQPLVYIGTSATMAAAESSEDQNIQVAKAASIIFGSPFTPEQIVNETLVKSLGGGELHVTIENLRKCIDDEKVPETLEEIKSFALSIWIEEEIALSVGKGIIKRQRPYSLTEIALKLSQKIERNVDACRSVIQRLLENTNSINNKLKNGEKPVLPFKINQFVSQTGSVYVTLDPPESRYITLDPSSYIIGEANSKKPLFPVVFSRHSGTEYICVRKNLAASLFEPREFNQRIAEEEEDSYEIGYVLFNDPENSIWNEDDINNLPDSWVKVSKSGEVKVQKDYQQSIPQKIWFNQFGKFSTKPEEYEFEGLYISAPLLLDPTAGIFYDRRTSEGTKLAKLGTEGRSTATTVLATAIIQGMHNDGLPSEEQKLLSFTDNRQDAALQAGHFNDFIKVGQLRAAIFKALSAAEGNTLDYSTIAGAVFDALHLKQEQYSTAPSELPFLAIENEDAFKQYILYRVLYDLRRGWRVILPNLEQCGLLEIRYKKLREAAESVAYWKDVPVINQMNPDELEDFLQQTLDYFRRNYSIFLEKFEPKEIEKWTNVIKQKIKKEWGLDKKEEMEIPGFMRVKALKLVHQKIYTSSLGKNSYFGKYFSRQAKKAGIELSGEEYTNAIALLLAKLEKAGYLKSISVKNGSENLELYKLLGDKIIWQLGNGLEIQQDKVRQQSYKPVNKKVNQYFKKFYTSRFDQMKTLEAKEHTAQIKNEDRQDREERFRTGEISLLCCSPTMELGIDIATLNVVHLRNVPPNPANYAQRAGRAGRGGQAALIFTFCSSYSPHDQHYFRNPTQMAAGIVSPPRIDLSNEELLRTHLNAVFLSRAGIQSLEDSLANLFDMDRLDTLPLKEAVIDSLKLSKDAKQQIVNYFKIAASDLLPKLSTLHWFNDDWINRQVESAPAAFNESLDRWRELFRNAQRMLQAAQTVINNPILSNDSPEKKQAFIDQKQAARQIDILQNKTAPGERQLSEFYPFRYLAAEGFLPGYNFVRLPLRVFIPQEEGGEFISRPRFLGIREFAPGNIVYHNGVKYKVNQLLLSDGSENSTKMKVGRSTGFTLTKADYELEYCPFSGQHLQTEKDCIRYTDLLPMKDSRSISVERINCEEEERLALGYDVKTFFTVEGGMERIQTIKIKDGEDELLRVKYIPAATLIKINEKFRIRKEPGFLFNVKTGFWKKDAVIEKDTPDAQNLKRVKLYTTDTADALYIYPMKALAFEDKKESDAIITFQYALKRAIENVFQVESNEIGSEIMGPEEWPNIMIYEAAQGSLGVLSQIVENADIFKKLIQEAYSICYFENNEDTRPEIGPATYADLLSYYNQRDHLRIDRHLIKEQLEKLSICKVEVQTNAGYLSYEEQYKSLMERIDPNSVTEKEFLQYLYKSGLKLPDEAQVSIPGIYVRPDFYYKKGNVCVFCDGTPHDKADVIEHDKKQREALANSGYDVFVYYYKNSLPDLIAGRSDIFTKVK